MDVYEFCKGAIAHYKIPKYVKIVDSFPLTITGKVISKLLFKKLFIFIK